MNGTDFGRLVATLRRELRDEDDQIWSQKRLGTETGLGEVVSGKIERGQRINLDGDTLTRLAEALGLTAGERKEFFIAAVDVDDGQVSYPDGHAGNVFNDVLRTVEEIYTPAFVIDSYGDLVAAKTSAVRLYNIPPDSLSGGFGRAAAFNIMRLLFAPEAASFRSAFGHTWERIALRNMAFFRCITLRYRFTEYFAKVFSELRSYSLFRQFWQRARSEEAEFCLGNQLYEYWHPELGLLHYYSTLSTALTSRGELYLAAYAPADASTAEVFVHLNAHGGEYALRLAAWPEKSVPERTSI